MGLLMRIQASRSLPRWMTCSGTPGIVNRGLLGTVHLRVNVTIDLRKISRGE